MCHAPIQWPVAHCYAFFSSITAPFIPLLEDFYFVLNDDFA